MAILAFQKPDKVIMLESDDFNGTFEFRPLEPGYGITIGNALRRILLSSLEGFSITSLKIEGKLDDPDVNTQVARDIVTAPFNILKRTLLLPMELFSTKDKNTSK